MLTCSKVEPIQRVLAPAGPALDLWNCMWTGTLETGADG